MEEKDFTSVVYGSIISRGGFAHKMPDPSYQELMRGAPRRPYDMYYVLRGQCVHLENKFLRGYQAFSLDAIRPHQYDNLLTIKRSAEGGSILALIGLAVWVPRKVYDVFFFDIGLLDELRSERKSISKKSLLALAAEERCLKIAHDDISIERAQEVQVWQRSQIPLL